MESVESFKVLTPIGQLWVFCCENKVLEINLGMDAKKRRHCAERSRRHPGRFAMTVKKQLEAYFVDANTIFNIDTHVTGTDFQKSVWREISGINRGDTMTYSAIAKRLGSSARAVGNACRANPVPVIVPCHRVVAKSGLGGFAGQRTGVNIDVKTWLLNHENAL